MNVTDGLGLLFCFFGTLTSQVPDSSPPPIKEAVVVTIDKIEARIGDTPASVVSFSRVEITSAAAPTVDDILRQSPGFSIFRRSSSRNANPTTQGVSLRGVGASGASRTLVLFDGVPLNDPFGGWVQWNRISPVSIETIEILRGGASSLYGDSGLSGAVNILPRKVEDRFLFSGDVFGGTQRTLSGAGFGGFKSRGWSATAMASNYQTKGFEVVEEAVRGPVDVFAGVRTLNLSARLIRSFNDRATIFVVPSYFGEVRTNGTGLQTNRTHSRQLFTGGEIKRSGGYDLRFNWRAFAGSQVFDQVFSVVNATRTSETLNRLQRVPAQQIGVSGHFSTVFGGQTLLGGFEFKNVRGTNNELAFSGNLPTIRTEQTGRQRTLGGFVQDFARIGKRAVVVGTLRYDRWLNHSAFNSTVPLATGTANINQFPDRNHDSISPRIAVLYRISGEFSFYASASKSFRAPTLNELYRGFRVGSVVTQANENLKSERAGNIEAGLSTNLKKTSFRVSGFWSEIEDAISNVTLTSTPTLITRQRQNAGQIRSRGIEIEGEARFGRLDVKAGYLLAGSIVNKFPSNPAIEGRLVPQVARHNFTVQLRSAVNRWVFAVQGRASSNQFDDDLNLFRLDPFFQADIFVSRRVKENVQIYGAVENIFNSRYSVGRTPVRTLNSPINFRIGVRYK